MIILFIGDFMKQRRMMAYFIDILLVLILTTMMTNSYTFNPYLYDYDEAYNNYTEVYNDIYSDLDLSKISDDDISDLNDAMYKLEKTNMYYYVYYLVFVFIYFVIFQWLNKGQTLGKKIFKIKVVNSEEENLNLLEYIKKYLFSGSMMVMGFHAIVLVKVIAILAGISASKYMTLFMILNFVGIIIEIILLISLFRYKNNEMFFDKVSKTKVVEA